MIGAAQITEILSVYKKHGWILRRVLLSDKLRGELKAATFEGIEPEPSKLDGLWFSRPSKGTLEAWELRHLSAAPYALVEVIERDAEEDDRAEVFRQTEERMKDAVMRKN